MSVLSGVLHAFCSSGPIATQNRSGKTNKKRIEKKKNQNES